jgi:hypothetical protein
MRITVFRRPAFDQGGQITIFPPHFNALHYYIRKNLPRLPGKRVAFPVLVLTGRPADKHQISPWMPFTKYNPFSRTRQFAPEAFTQIVSDVI